jgi:hypothetical protein
MDNKNLTLEQKIVYFLAKKGYITNVGDVTKALRDFMYAEKMLTIEGEPGVKDDIKKLILNGEIEGIESDCNHKPLTNKEIQEVFDNDTK